MKKILTLFFIFCLFTGKSLQAQKEFAPIGAEWWYYAETYDNNYLGSTRNTFQAVVTKDTIIQGISCRQIDIKRRFSRRGVDGSLPFKSIKTPFYFYEHEDTVFVHNEIFNRFTPLYIYNVNDGDTVCLPVPPAPVPDLRLNPISGDTSFCFVVDSIRSVLYDTTYLRTYYTRALVEESSGESLFPAYNWGGAWYDNGFYIEHILSVYSLLPFKRLYCCDHNPFEFVYAPFYKLRCYTDPNYSIRLTQEPCDTIVSFPVSIKEQVSGQGIFSIYPNPASDQVTIAHSVLEIPEIEVQVSNVSGQVVKKEFMRMDNQHIRVDLSNLPSGFYLLGLKINGQQVYHKLIIQNN